MLFALNHGWGPFKDARVRRALNLAVDRWAAQNTLSKIAIVKTPGGIVFPGHPLAASKEELEGMEGFWPDINKSRAEAKRLLKEAGAEGLTFTLNNRASDQLPPDRNLAHRRVEEDWGKGEAKRAPQPGVAQRLPAPVQV